MLNKFLNPNKEFYKSQLTTTDADEIISLIEAFNNGNIADLTYGHKDSELEVHISNNIPKKDNEFVTYSSESPRIHSEASLTNYSGNLIMDEDSSEDLLIEEKQAVSAGNIIKAHMAGSVFLKPSPSEPEFVNSGSHVEPGTVLCLLEAMKLFSEVKSNISGKISKIFVEHGDLVQEGDPLFEII